MSSSEQRRSPESEDEGVDWEVVQGRSCGAVLFGFVPPLLIALLAWAIGRNSTGPAGELSYGSWLGVAFKGWIPLLIASALLGLWYSDRRGWGVVKQAAALTGALLSFAVSIGTLEHTTYRCVPETFVFSDEYRQLSDARSVPRQLERVQSLEIELSDREFELVTIRSLSARIEFRGTALIQPSGFWGFFDDDPRATIGPWEVRAVAQHTPRGPTSYSIRATHDDHPWIRKPISSRSYALLDDPETSAQELVAVFRKWDKDLEDERKEAEDTLVREQSRLRLLHRRVLETEAGAPNTDPASEEHLKRLADRFRLAPMLATWEDFVFQSCMAVLQQSPGYFTPVARGLKALALIRALLVFMLLGVYLGSIGQGRRSPNA